MTLLKNPVLRGFNPDPSICRKGENYYLVTSSFEYFPALPLYHSKDLANWNQIGFAIEDPSLINLVGCRPSKGIYAPTIRYNPEDDMFYLIIVLCHSDNYHENEIFFIKAKDPQGPWMDKTIIHTAEGIDPSFFFEGKKAYCMGNLQPDPQIRSSHRHIWIDEIDLTTGELAGKRKIILQGGAVQNAKCPEGPHIYHFGAYYYLLISEGGTGLNHAISVFRSTSIWGPYECDPRNPILTHRNYGSSSPFNSIGHADIVQAPDGSFWAVLLGCRTIGNKPESRIIGRETFIIPVTFEDDWPVFCPDSGKVAPSYALPWNTELITPSPAVQNVFKSFDWETIRTYDKPFYTITAEGISLKLLPATIKDYEHVSFLGRRQDEPCFTSVMEMDFSPLDNNEIAGLMLLMDDKRYALAGKTRDKDKSVLQLSTADGTVCTCPASQGITRLRVVCDMMNYSFQVKDENNCWVPFGPPIPGCTFEKLNQGYSGLMIGMYASSNHHATQNSALFTHFSYLAKPYEYN